MRRDCRGGGGESKRRSGHWITTAASATLPPPCGPGATAQRACARSSTVTSSDSYAKRLCRVAVGRATQPAAAGMKPSAHSPQASPSWPVSHQHRPSVLALALVAAVYASQKHLAAVWAVVARADGQGHRGIGRGCTGRALPRS